MSTSSISSPSPRSKPNDENNWLKIIKTDDIEYILTGFIQDYYKEIYKLKIKIHNICYRGDSDEESYNEDSNIESYSKDLNSLELIYNRLIQYKKELLKYNNINSINNINNININNIVDYINQISLKET